MNSKFKKFIIFLVIFSLIYSFSVFKETKKAEAFVVECPSCSKWVKDVAQFAKDIARWAKEDMMESMRDVVAKKLIDYIVDQTVTWIQGGGSPKFVTNWNGFLKDAANIAFNEVVSDVDAAWLCAPFGPLVKLSLQPAPKFSQQLNCTLDDVVANIEDFYKDFKNGGWIAYEYAWQPNNNYYGTMLMAYNKLSQKTAEQTEAAKNEALAGQGYTSVKRCKGGGFSYLQLETMEGMAQGSTGNLVKDSNGNYCLPDDLETITQGSTVAAVTNKAMVSDIDWTASIKSWTSALFNAAINRVIKEGVGLMKNSSSGGGTSYYPAEYQSQANQFNAELQQQQQNQSQISDVNEILNEWQYINNDKVKSLSYAEQIQTIFETIRSRNCSPTVSDIEMQLIQSDINRLTTEIASSSVEISEAANLISEITNAQTIRETTLSQQDYQAFINKYDTLEMQQQIASGSARASADQEVAAKTSDLTIAQNRLNICIGGQ
jgi:hypothetical protein